MFTGARCQEPAGSEEIVNKATATSFVGSKKTGNYCVINIANLQSNGKRSTAQPRTLEPERSGSEQIFTDVNMSTKRMTRMTLFAASIITLGLQCVTGTPQLRLSHTGYEIISFNDQTPDDSLPEATKFTLQNNVSRYGGIDFLNLEKADAIDDESDSFALPLQEQHKRHYDPESSTAGSKVISEIRRNTVVPSARVSSSEASEKTNVYLAVGIPTRFDRPSSRAKESSNLFSSSEITSSNVGSKNSFEDSRREKNSTWTNRSRIDDKETETAKKLAKQSNGNRGSDKASSMLDSDFDPAAPKEDSKFEKVTALLADAHRALDLVEAKSDSDEKRESIVETKPAFPTVGKLPTIQIHRQRSFYLPKKSPAMFSPIYPSGFDIVTGNFLKKTVIPVNEPQQTHARSFRLDPTSPKNRKYVDADVEARKKLIGRQINEVNSGAKEFAKSYMNDRVPSLLKLKNILGNVKHDIFNNPRIGNGSPLTGLLPVPAGTSLYVSPLSLMLQQPLRALPPAEAYLEFNSMPLITSHIEHSHPHGDLPILHPQGRVEETMSTSVINAPRAHHMDNYLDSKYLDSKASHRIAKSGSKTDFFKNYLGKMKSMNFQPTVRSIVVNQPARELLAPSAGAAKGSLVSDIAHVVAPDESGEPVFDVDKEDTAKEVREMGDAPKDSCKRMKAVTPPFYQFLSKFTDIVLDNALRYETSPRIRDGAAKLMDVAKKNFEHTSGL